MRLLNLPWLIAAILALLALSGCGEERQSVIVDPVGCVAEAPVCDPPCGVRQICTEACTCGPAPACDSDFPVCTPACRSGQICSTGCTCVTPPRPEVACDPDQPVCTPGCNEGEFCAEDCTCALAPCDPENPICTQGCGVAEYCDESCDCAPLPCDPQDPVCAPGCGEGEICNAACACEAFACDSTAPRCPGGCDEGEFCNAACACEALCDGADPVCDPGCSDDEYCSPQCRCVERRECNPEAPVCVPGCAEGKVCNAECDCVEPCDPASPLCTPACSPIEACNAACQCEPRACDPEQPVCDPPCGQGDFCTSLCLCGPALACDPLRPVCEPGCGDDAFCGRDCTCHPEGLRLPDLTVDVPALINSIFIEEREFTPTNCAIVEGCVLAPGFRRLMRFSTMTPNIGNVDMFMGEPDDNPELFEFSPCHGHYHFNGYAEYRLYDEANQVVARGHKQAFCLLDSTRYVTTDPSVAEERRYNCGFQGIQRGWADIYGSNLDCQWVDITGIAPGRYRLEVSLNNFRTIQELSYDNNVSSINVIVPPVDPLGTCDLQPRARGARRDCGWQIAANMECEPGEPMAIGCTSSGACQIGRCDGDTVMRVCEGVDVGCTAGQALGSNDDACGSTCSVVNYVCPDSGRVTILTGGNNPSEVISCDLSQQVGFVFPDPTSPCTAGEQGTDRDCGWEPLPARTCTPGEEVSVGCNASDGCALGSCEGDTMLRICAGHNDNCTAERRIAGNDDACDSLCSRVVFTCPEDGVYTPLTAPFRSTREATCLAEATNSGGCPIDGLEPNDDPLAPVQIIEGTASELSVCRGEREYYRIFATEADVIDVELEFYAEGAAVRLSLFDSLDVLVAEVDGDSGEVRLLFPVEEAGPHRLRVQLIEGAQTAYDMTLTLN